MQKIVKKQIGRHTHVFVVEGETLFDLLIEEGKLSFEDGELQKCPCGSDDLKLGAHKAQNKFEYVHVRCKKCGATLNFGRRTDNKETYYFRKDKDSKEFKWQLNPNWNYPNLEEEPKGNWTKYLDAKS